MSDMQYFVYRLIDPFANEVFYVGKGSGDRIQTHLSAAKRGASGYLYNKIRKIWNSGGQPEIERIWECDDEAEALQKEIEFIAIYGRRVNKSGSLCNVTIGGEGCTLDGDALAARNAAIAEGLKGRKLPIDSIEKIARTKRRQYASNSELYEKTVELLSAARKNVNEDKRIVAVSRAAKNRIWSEESRKKLSESRKGIRYGVDVIERMRQSKMKAVICHNTGKVFQNSREAAKENGVGHKSVWRVCNGKYPSVKGLIFSYKEKTP